MLVTRKVIQALFEDPSSTDAELAAKVFGASSTKNGKLAVPKRHAAIIREIMKRLMRLRNERPA